jgi:UDP-N-acetylmuramoyl-L-alanyl-D-glutamate--2,6-diaminopimelate ligase
MSVPRPVPPAGEWARELFTIGVTGTNGKTSTTRMIASALRAGGESVLRIDTLGVELDEQPLPRGRDFAAFLATMRRASERGCKRAVLEATSLALAQGYARAWRFDLGVFTNLSPDHLQTHGTYEHYLAAKAQLFVQLGPGRTAVFNACDPHALFVDQATPADVKRLYFGSPTRGQALHEADLSATRIDVSATGTRVALAPSPIAEALGGTLHTRMVGEVFGENALAAALASWAAGVPPTAIVSGIAACEVVPGRFEVVVHGDERPTVVVDYAHTPDALARTCATARSLAGPHGRVLVVFGAGGGASADKRAPMGEAVGRAAELALVTSDNPRDEDPQAIAAMLIAGLERVGANYELELDRARAIARAIELARPRDVVVIAGKGHEQGQRVGGHTLPFSDADVVRAQFVPLR